MSPSKYTASPSLLPQGAACRDTREFFDQGNNGFRDFNFFKERVQPVFFAAGPDQKACVQCHHNHGILKLTAPPDGGTITDELTRENYRSALRVVNLADPEKSLLLQKPLGSADVEGIVGAKSIPHGGELRWPERTSSAEYQAVLAWINGGRLDATEREDR